MLKQRRAAAVQLKSRLLETETAIDQAISKMADLTGYMPVARENANLSAVIGQDAIVQAGQTLAALIDARGQIVETHNRLAEARDRIGLRELAMGEGQTKPPLVQGESTQTIVSLVEEAA